MEISQYTSNGDLEIIFSSTNKISVRHSMTSRLLWRMTKKKNCDCNVDLKEAYTLRKSEKNLSLYKLTNLYKIAQDEADAFVKFMETEELDKRRYDTKGSLPISLSIDRIIANYDAYKNEFAFIDKIKQTKFEKIDKVIALHWDLSFIDNENTDRMETIKFILSKFTKCYNNNYYSKCMLI